MSDVLIKVENLSKKFCFDLKKSLWYGVKDIAKDEMFTTDNFAPDTSTLVYKMRQMQDDMLGLA